MTELKRILLVEDNPNDIELTLMALQEFHLANEIIVVRDGNQALDYLYHRGAYKGNADGEPIMILLDLNLPGKDGREVLKTMKADVHLKNIPVVMLTSSREEAERTDSHKLGVRDYLSKPIDFFQFAEVVGRLGASWAVVKRPSQKNQRVDSIFSSGKVL